MQVTLRQFVKELQHIIQQQAITNSIQLGKGQCASLEEYKQKVGFIRGLEAASDMAGNMVQQLEDQAREADKELPDMEPQDND